MAVPQSFPAKIYQILENESPEIIQWNENGQSFRIMDHGRFEREIVPKYFRHNQISSVQRQLNLYGFKCISRGEFKRSFFHPKFRRGEWETVKKLTRFVPLKKGAASSENLEEPGTPEAAPKEKEPASSASASAAPTSAPPRAAPSAPVYMPFMYSYPTGLPAGQSSQSQALPVRSFSTWNEAWDQAAPGQQLIALPLMTPAESTASFLNNTRMTFQNWVPRVGLPVGMSAGQGQTAGPSQGHSMASVVLPGSGMRVDAPAANLLHQQAPSGSAGQQSAAVPMQVNPDYDMMLEFGVFDADLLAQSPRAHQQQQGAAQDSAQSQATMVSPRTQYPHRMQPFGGAPPSGSTEGASGAAAEPVIADTVCMAGSSSNASKSGGVDVSCMTDITYSEALQAFVRREEAP